MSSETAYITFMGRSVWALLNSYYAVVRGTPIRPTLIFVLGEENFSDQIEKVTKGLTILSEAYGLKPEIHIEMIASANYQDACQKIPKTVHYLKTKGMQVALDITPGRKAMVAAALISSLDELDHIYYLAISSIDDVAKPYMMIPLQMQELKDFRDVVRACKEGT